MIYFLIRVLVNALALALTVIITPGLRMQPLLPPVISLSTTYIIIGILFGIINAFVRPLVLLFTARLIVRTMGVFAIVINAFLFWLLQYLAPSAFQISSPRLLWIVIASFIMALIVVVMEAFFGLDKPEFRSATEGQFYWRWIGMLSAGRRNAIAENLRVAQITDIVGRYTKDLAVDMTPLARFRVFMQELLFRDLDPRVAASLPEKVRYMLQELGPTFVKFGQIMSSRTQSLPPEWETELERLQSNVPPFPYETARAMVMRELGSSPETLFATFEKEPFAAASTAQVHRATLLDGTAVVVKIQRPNINVTVKADLNVMRDLATRMQRGRDWAKEIDIKGLVNEFADGILTELDYRNEASNLRFMAHNMQRFREIHIPQVYGQFSTSKVLTMELVKGVKISNVAAIKEAGIDCHALGTVFVQAMMKQALFDGFFHADPHPGNVLVDLETGEINLLDLGLVGELNRQQRMALADLLISIQEKDGYSMGKAALRLSNPLPDHEVDEKRFLETMERFVDRYLKLEDVDLALVFSALQDTLRRAGLRLDSEFTLVLKTLMQAEEIVHRLDPKIIITETAYDSVLLLAREQVNAEELGKTVRLQVTRSAREVAYRLPSLVEATTKWLDQYEKGKLTVTVDTSDLGKQVEKLDIALSKTMSRLTIALVLVGWIVGSAIASTISLEVQGFNISELAYYMFIAGAVVGAYVVLRALWDARRQDNEYD